jgi:hypothetical protein
VPFLADGCSHEGAKLGLCSRKTVRPLPGVCMELGLCISKAAV